MLVYQFLQKKGCIGLILSDDAAKTQEKNDKKYNELKQYLQSKYAISDEEIDDEELQKLSILSKGHHAKQNPRIKRNDTIYHTT